MVSKEPSKCQLTSTENEAEQASLEIKYVLDPNRQIRKRNKALQVRFKDIREAQNEQEKRLSAAQQLDKKTMKAISYKAAYRKYMTVPARRSIPNVTRSTGVQTSPDLKKRYQTFPLERKKVNVIKIAPTIDTFRRQNNDWAIDIKGSNLNKDSAHTLSSAEGSNQKNTDISSHNNFIKLNKQADSDSFGDSSSKDPEMHSYTEESSHILKLADSNPTEQNHQLCNTAKYDKGASENQNFNQSALQLTEFTSFHLTEANCELTQPDSSNSFTQNSPQNVRAREVHERTLHPTSLNYLPMNGQACSLQFPQSEEETSESTASNTAPRDESQSQSNQTVSVMESNQQIMPLTEVVDLKAQLQIMENLISSSQETIKVLLGVIQELEKGEALREGLSYRTGQDTANCDTCRNSACIIYSWQLSDAEVISFDGSISCSLNKTQLYLHSSGPRCIFPSHF
ncbi:inhibitory synaptic factor 2A isoform X2 [Scyliorhinus canicula]|uniref:inhibitory synaptic factor 2A isoform X2 n=1 Tax=Scyliorhinus canicula TaxID=7830 RepID=UPI0018F4EA90|nr:inhibitory synaptic factor 2A isoform X2 [Scyliorhinus canicula]